MSASRRDAAVARAIRARRRCTNALWDAVRDDNVRLVKRRLEAGACANSLQESHYHNVRLSEHACATVVRFEPILEYALFCRSVEVCQLLAKYGAQGFCQYYNCIHGMPACSACEPSCPWRNHVMWESWNYHPSGGYSVFWMAKRSLDKPKDIDFRRIRYNRDVPLTTTETNFSRKLALALSLCHCRKTLPSYHLSMASAANDVYVARMLLEQFTFLDIDRSIFDTAIEAERWEILSVLCEKLKPKDLRWSVRTHPYCRRSMKQTVQTCLVLMHCSNTNPWTALPFEIACSVFELV